MAEQTAYLDNAATTRVCDAAVDAAARAMRDCYGNPSALHSLGAAAARELERSRGAVAALLGCQSEAVYFTSGGSEANNLALFGAAGSCARRGKKLVITAVEHPSVENAAKRLEQTGWEITRIFPLPDGTISAEQLADAVDGGTSLVSMMLVNNETGAIFPVEEAARLIRAKNPSVIIHCDGVQAFGKLPLRLSRTELDIFSVSGHKLQAPKGVGALYLRRGARILPLIYGGGQERGLRSGTEPMPAIAGLGAACERLDGRIAENFERIAALREQTQKKLVEISGLCINSPINSSPYILNISIPGYRSETLLHFLESRGVYVSSGSACAKGAVSPSLAAMGLDRARIDGAIRISFICDTPDYAPQMLADALRDAVAQVAH